MVEPTGHCPYLGLKQNRAIRFASPTPEHRCYVSGEPLEIPVDQSSYCLSQGHVHCPLYMGLSAPTTNDTPTAAGGALVIPTGGVRGWFATLPPRDRAIYAIMIGMLAIIVAIYLIVGLPTLLRGLGGSGTTPLPTSAVSTSQSVIVLSTDAANPTDIPPTDIPPTPTDLPTSTPAPEPTAQPTQPTLIILPTQAPTQPAATSAPTLPATSAPTAGALSVTAQPTVAAQPTVVAQPTLTTRPATSSPQPTRVPQPTQAPPLPATQPPTSSQQTLTLYFGDSTGTLYVPVRRNVNVEDNRVAEAAIRELIAGPRNGLGRLVPSEAGLLNIRIDNGTAFANFNRAPDSGDDRGFTSIVFTLTEFPSIARVQFQVSGQNLGGARGRPVLNPINPQNLPVDFGATEFLPLYFPSVDGIHDVRLIRMVPKTKQVAEGTVRALLEGPGNYGSAVRRAIPEGTELRGVELKDGIITLNFSQPFAGASDAATRTIVASLTTLRNVGGVQFLVEGQPFAGGKIFRRPAINPE